MQLALAEYITHLRFGACGCDVLLHLPQAGSVIALARGPREHICCWVNRVVRHRFDRAFVGVACAAKDKLLISHDFTEVQTAKRASIHRELGVRIIKACDCGALLRETAVWLQ